MRSMTGQTPMASSARSALGRDYGGRSASERRAERRARLLAAATELFGVDGFHATSIERVCTRANVSTRNFYEEFTSRESLLIELHEQISQRAFDAVLAAIAEAGEASTAERVAMGIRAYVGSTSADPRWARIAYVEVVGVSAEVEQHRLTWRKRLSTLVEAEAAFAVSRGDGIERDFHHRAVAFVGAVTELVYQWTIENRQAPVETICAELTSVALAMLTT